MVFLDQEVDTPGQTPVMLVPGGDPDEVQLMVLEQPDDLFLGEAHL